MRSQLKISEISLKTLENWLKEFVVSVRVNAKHYPLLVVASFLVAGIFLAFIYLILVFNVADTHKEATRGIAFLLGLPLAAAGLLLAYKRTSALESQSKTDSERLVANSERLVTETFAKSIELLGHDKPAVRQGSIYALGKIAKTHKDDHAVIISSLCAFIRDWSQESEANKLRKEGSIGNSRLPIDVETAIKVIKDRNIENDKEASVEGFSYDLSNVTIKNADFSRANLSYFNLQDSNFHYCAFNKAVLTGASLIGATFKGKQILKMLS